MVISYQSESQPTSGGIGDGGQEEGQPCAPHHDQGQVYQDEEGDDQHDVLYTIQQIKVVIALEGVKNEGEDECKRDDERYVEKVDQVQR